MAKEVWKLKRRIFEIIEVSRPGDNASRVFDVFILSLIAVNVLAVILETVPVIENTVGRGFYYFELVSVIIFSVEYLLRLWTANLKPGHEKPFLGRLRFMVTFMALVDLAAIAPFYLPMLIAVDLRFVRALRLFRLFRLFKVGRYSQSIDLLKTVLREKKAELAITAFVLGMLIILSSSVMYFVENDAQPGEYSSIPQAMWWSVSAVTSVGYGDVYPKTTVGKMLGAVIALLGIGLFALPTGILAAGFNDVLRRRGKKAAQIVHCPKCGEPIVRE